MRLGVPFIAPRQLGAVGDQLGKQILPSIEWCTGQSGAPPDRSCSSLVLDPLPFLEHPTIGPAVSLAHRTLSSVPNRPLARATRCPLIALMTVGSGGSDSSDSPVNHRTVQWILAATLSPFPESDEFVADVLGRGRCSLTGQSGTPPYSPTIFSHVAPPIPESGQFAAEPAWGTRHCPVCQAGAGFGCPEPYLLQFFSSFLGTISST
jgi:hypothetical protein